MNLFEEEFIVKNNQQRSMCCDIKYDTLIKNKPIILFSHGFKGFKDFGCFNLIAKEFAKNGFAFIKFNFSMNGTSIENPIEFVDLDAFSENTFTQELNDLGQMIDFVCNDAFCLKHQIDKNQLFLMGHSMGGGISILKAFEDSRVKKLVTLASIDQFGRLWTEEIILNWKNNGIRYEFNTRTQQQMPLKYLIYEDFQSNYNRLNITEAIKNLKIDFCAFHGNKDETIPYQILEKIKSLNKNIDTHIIESANHTFGMTQPWLSNQLPNACLEFISISISFLSK